MNKIRRCEAYDRIKNKWCRKKATHVWEGLPDGLFLCDEHSIPTGIENAYEESEDHK